MFREGPDGFKGGLSAEKYISITGAPRATVTRDLRDLVGKGALLRKGERKHTRYLLNLKVIWNARFIVWFLLLYSKRRLGFTSGWTRDRFRDTAISLGKMNGSTWNRFVIISSERKTHHDYLSGLPYWCLVAYKQAAHAADKPIEC